MISYDSARGGVSVITEKGDVTTSYLLIQNADLADSGKYSCSPSNADVATIRVHVLNGKCFYIYSYIHRHTCTFILLLLLLYGIEMKMMLHCVPFIICVEWNEAAAATILIWPIITIAPTKPSTTYLHIYTDIIYFKINYKYFWMLNQT